MIFTDRFVYVHQPKTGGTFVRHVLARLYQADRATARRHWSPRFPWRWDDEVAVSERYGVYVDHPIKHGTCRQIPSEHRGKPILGTIRNPFDWYVSKYEFGWWKRAEFLPFFRAVPGFRDLYPYFPELDFAEYMTLAEQAFGGFRGAVLPMLGRWAHVLARVPYRNPPAGEGDAAVGLCTEDFLKYYSRHPRRILGDPDAHLDSGGWRREMFDVHFIPTRFLNRGLYDFLVEIGYRTEDITFVLGLGRVLPEGRKKTEGRRWERYYTPELRARVLRRDRLIFAAFPQFFPAAEAVTP